MPRTYHSIMEFESADPLFLGQIPLTQANGGVAHDTAAGSDTDTLLGDDGTVPFPWGDADHSAIPLPGTVDATDPFQIAPMAGFYQRPLTPPMDALPGRPETVHVYATDPAETVEATAIDGIEYREETTDSSDDDGRMKLTRWYDWDNDVAPPDAVAESPPAFPDVTHLVGFVDGQDMYDPYTHLGRSAASTNPAAIRDVLSRLDGVPLWSPRAHPISDYQTFDADDVFRVAPAATR
jgi:hypothetical protein